MSNKITMSSQTVLWNCIDINDLLLLLCGIRVLVGKYDVLYVKLKTIQWKLIWLSEKIQRRIQYIPHGSQPIKKIKMRFLNSFFIL